MQPSTILGGGPSSLACSSSSSFLNAVAVVPQMAHVIFVTEEREKVLSFRVPVKDPMATTVKALAAEAVYRLTKTVSLFDEDSEGNGGATSSRPKEVVVASVFVGDECSLFYADRVGEVVDLKNEPITMVLKGWGAQRAQQKKSTNASTTTTTATTTTTNSDNARVPRENEEMAKKAQGMSSSSTVVAPVSLATSHTSAHPADIAHSANNTCNPVNSPTTTRNREQEKGSNYVTIPDNANTISPFRKEVVLRSHGGATLQQQTSVSAASRGAAHLPSNEHLSRCENSRTICGDMDNLGTATITATAATAASSAAAAEAVHSTPSSYSLSPRPRSAAPTPPSPPLAAAFAIASLSSSTVSFGRAKAETPQNGNNNTCINVNGTHSASSDQSGTGLLLTTVARGNNSTNTTVDGNNTSVSAGRRSSTPKFIIPPPPLMMASVPRPSSAAPATSAQGTTTPIVDAAAAATTPQQGIAGKPPTATPATSAAATAASEKVTKEEDNNDDNMMVAAGHSPHPREPPLPFPPPRTCTPPRTKENGSAQKRSRSPPSLDYHHQAEEEKEDEHNNHHNANDNDNDNVTDQGVSSPTLHTLPATPAIATNTGEGTTSIPLQSTSDRSVVLHINDGLGHKPLTGNDVDVATVTRLFGGVAGLSTTKVPNNGLHTNTTTKLSGSSPVGVGFYVPPAPSTVGVLKKGGFFGSLASSASASFLSTFASSASYVANATASSATSTTTTAAAIGGASSSSVQYRPHLSSSTLSSGSGSLNSSSIPISQHKPSHHQNQKEPVWSAATTVTTKTKPQQHLSNQKEPLKEASSAKTVTTKAPPLSKWGKEAHKFFAPNYISDPSQILREVRLEKKRIDEEKKRCAALGIPYVPPSSAVVTCDDCRSDNNNNGTGSDFMAAGAAASSASNSSQQQNLHATPQRSSSSSNNKSVAVTPKSVAVTQKSAAETTKRVTAGSSVTGSPATRTSPCENDKTPTVATPPSLDLNTLSSAERASYFAKNKEAFATWGPDAHKFFAANYSSNPDHVVRDARKERKRQALEAAEAQRRAKEALSALNAAGSSPKMAVVIDEDDMEDEPRTVKARAVAALSSASSGNDRARDDIARGVVKQAEGGYTQPHHHRGEEQCAAFDDGCDEENCPLLGEKRGRNGSYPNAATVGRNANKVYRYDMSRAKGVVGVGGTSSSAVSRNLLQTFEEDNEWNYNKQQRKSSRGASSTTTTSAAGNRANSSNPQKKAASPQQQQPAVVKKEGWGADAYKFFDPTTYATDPKKAVIPEELLRVPIRTRRQVALEALAAVSSSSATKRKR